MNYQRVIIKYIGHQMSLFSNEVNDVTYVRLCRLFLLALQNGNKVHGLKQMGKVNHLEEDVLINSFERNIGKGKEQVDNSMPIFNRIVDGMARDETSPRVRTVYYFYILFYLVHDQGIPRFLTRE